MTRIPPKDWYRLRPAGDGITWIDEPHIKEFYRCNIWHMRGRDRDLMVDSGMGVVSLRQWVPLVSERPLDAIASHTHFDHIGKQARAESARMMVARMKRIAGEKAAVFLSGDLNTTYDNALLDPLKAWMQSARHAAPVTDELPTFNDFGKRSLWIDFIFARNARALAYRTLVDSGRYGVPFLSDHNPVYALYKL